MTLSPPLWATGAWVADAWADGTWATVVIPPSVLTILDTSVESLNPVRACVYIGPQRSTEAI